MEPLSGTYLTALNYIHQHGPMSRSDLATDMKLTKAAVTGITNELIKQDILCEKGEQYDHEGQSSRGRRKILLEVNENYRLVFGVVIYKEKMLVALSNLGGAVLDKREADLSEISYRDVLQTVVSVVGEIMKNNCISYENLLAMGLCSDKYTFSKINGDNSFLEKLSRTKRELSHAMPIKIYACETVVGALVAEQVFNPQEKLKNALMLMCDDCVDSAMLINGGIYRGDTSNVGDFENAKKGDDLQTVLEKFALRIKILDAERLYGFGEAFDRYNSEQSGKVKVRKAVTTTKSLYLSGCAIAVNEELYKRITNL